jgi:hypothetical protein
MRLPRLRRAGLIAAISILPLLQGVCAADVMDDLEALRKKVAAEESKQPADQSQRGAQLSTQFKLLENLIVRGDYDRARQMLGNFGAYGLSPEFADEWMQIADSLGKELEKKKAESLEKWRTEVDRLANDTSKGCLEAKTSDDLTPLLMRCSVLQMASQPGNTVLNERISRKLSGIANTLSSWATYLDFHTAGDARRANEILRNLLTNSSGFPVLSVAEIESRFSLVSDDTMDMSTALVKIFDGINTPDDLPVAQRRLKSFASNPLNPELGNLRNESQRMDLYIAAWKAAQTGDVTAAFAALNRTGGGSEEATRFYGPLKAQIEARLLRDKTVAWTRLTQNTGEETGAYLGRILDELTAKGDYATMLEVMAFAGQINRYERPSFTGERHAIEQFLAAQRFEDVGDGLAAVTNYRLVVAVPAGKYAPTTEAQDALKRLKTTYPEAFKSYEAVLSEQIRGLNQQMQILLNRSTGGRPSPPY